MMAAGRGAVESVFEGLILVELLHGKASRNMYLTRLWVVAV